MFSTRQVMAVMTLGFVHTPRPPEAGEDNAQRFAAVVVKAAHERRFIHCYPHAGYRGVKSDEYGWEWMVNAEWRARVLALLADAPVTDCVFTAPDDLEGWTFSCRSTVGVPYIAKLSLKDAA